MNKKNILIVGAGNLWRRDDGIGIVVIERLRALQQQHANAFFLAENKVDLLEIGTDGLSLLDILPNYPKAIIIDAVDMAAPVGTIKVFAPEEAKIKITNDALSTHGFGIAEMLKLAEQLNIQTKITIIGIQPKDISFGNELGLEIEPTVNAIIELIKLA